MKLRVLDLFSGIGGFSLGLERAGGFETVAFCEIEDYPRRVLARHWPGVPIYDDVRTLTADALRRDGIAVDVICGGFPCQDISFAGAGAGLAGERSGLWREYARLIGGIRPRFVIVENVAALLSRGLGDVLGDLAALGYDAEWHCIPAAAVGAPHRRDRVWIIANARSQQHESDCAPIGREIASQLYVADSEGDGRAICWARNEGFDNRTPSLNGVRDEPCRNSASNGAGNLANADSTGLQDWGQARKSAGSCETIWGVAQPEPQRHSSAWWAIEPDVGRVAHGVPSRVDRLKGLGNAVVSQIPELIGRAIMKSIEEKAA